MKRLLKVSTHDTNFRESFVFSAEKTFGMNDPENFNGIFMHRSQKKN